MSEEYAEQPAPAQPPPPPAAPVYPVTVSSDPRRKSPLLAAVLSMMPGLGQVYVGYYQRGFAHIFITASTIALLSTDVGGIDALIPLFAISLAFFWFYNIIDAGRRATFYNYALAGGQDITLPEDLLPSLGGSVRGGILIMAIGMLFLSNTLLNIRLDWLEEWWPVGIIAFGAYLVFRAREDATRRKKAESSEELSNY